LDGNVVPGRIKYVDPGQENDLLSKSSMYLMDVILYVNKSLNLTVNGIKRMYLFKRLGLNESIHFNLFYLCDLFLYRLSFGQQDL